MTLVLQDETGGVLNANAYADEAFFIAHHTDRGVEAVINGEYLTDEINAALVKATDFVDRIFNFVGRRINRDQVTQWPRIGAFDSDGFLATGIPLVIKQAVAEYAIRAILLGTLITDPERDATGQIVSASSSSVGPISESKTFAGGGTGSGFELPRYPLVDKLILARGLASKGSISLDLRRG
jgi:hypothetical protein